MIFIYIFNICIQSVPPLTCSERNAFSTWSNFLILNGVDDGSVLTKCATFSSPSLSLTVLDFLTGDSAVKFKKEDILFLLLSFHQTEIPFVGLTTIKYFIYLFIYLISFRFTFVCLFQFVSLIYCINLGGRFRFALSRHSRNICKILMYFCEKINIRT